MVENHPEMNFFLDGKALNDSNPIQDLDMYSNTLENSQLHKKI